MYTVHQFRHESPKRCCYPKSSLFLKRAFDLPLKKMLNTSSALSTGKDDHVTVLIRDRSKAANTTPHGFHTFLPPFGVIGSSLVCSRDPILKPDPVALQFCRLSCVFSGLPVFNTFWAFGWPSTSSSPHFLRPIAKTICAANITFW